MLKIFLYYKVKIVGKFLCKIMVYSLKNIFKYLM